MKKFLVIFFSVIFSINFSLAQTVSEIKKDSIDCDKLLKKAEDLLNNHNYFVTPYLDSAYFICSKSHNNYQLASINIYRGQSESLLSNYQAALKYYFKADSIIVEEKYLALKGSNYVRIANVYIQNTLYEDARKYLQKAKAIFEELKDKEQLIDIDFSSALILSNEDKDDEALLLLKKYENDTGTPEKKIHILGNIAVIFSKQEKYNEALAYYLRSFKIAEDYNDVFQKAVCCYNIGNIYEIQKNHPKWLEYITKALEYSKEGKNKEVIKDSYYDLYEYYTDRKNTEKALENFIQFYNLDKELSQEILQRDIELLTSKHKYKEAEERIKIADMQNELNNLEISKNEATINHLIIFSAILSFLLFVSFSLYIGRQNAYKKLLEKNIEVISSEEKIQTITKQLNANENEPAIGTPEEAEIFERVKKLFEEDKIFLDPDLAQTKFAEKLGIHTYKLSSVVNKYSDRNFSDLLNNYRIKYAQKLLVNTTNDKFSIEGIAQMSGYRYVSTFHAVFKKATGLTPSNYRKLANKN